MSETSAAELPQHIGIILDGNRRWAKQRGLPTAEGHREGFKTLQKVADAALERGIKYLTVYAFSTENWSRSKDEVGFLMAFAKKVIKKEINELHKKNVRFCWFGCEEKLEPEMLQLLRGGEELTKKNSGGVFGLCFNYGGQQEIAHAAEQLAASGRVISPAAIEQQLYCPLVPPIDMIIRTSGEMRISNFMLWRAAYSELYFTDTLWPDFDADCLDKALTEFASRKRRFGS